MAGRREGSITAGEGATARRQAILDLLQNLSGLEPLKRLFWSELNYEPVNTPLSHQGWPPAVATALAEDPVLFAAGGTNGGFHIIYARLASDGLLLAHQRRIVGHLLREHPYALFVVSNQARDHWHIINVQYDEQPARRRLCRRITIGPAEHRRTAAERLALLDLDTIGGDRFGLSPLAIQQRHDAAFDVEAVRRAFLADFSLVFRELEADLLGQTGDAVWAHHAALRFLNRCLVVSFIQPQGWRGDDADVMAAFRRADQAAGPPPDTFCERRLTALFGAAFDDRCHGDRGHVPESISRVLAVEPYLNGGLFGEHDLDGRHAFTITDARWQHIFDILQRYSFTLAEDGPFDRAVAVDPEMIGRVYERLVNVTAAVDERAAAGIFYTSRTEIDLMCRLALVDNLANHLGQEHKDRLYAVVFTFEPDAQADADRALARAGLWPALDQRLLALTVLDPACGAGSFLVGMLALLDDLQARAAAQRGIRESAYERKQRIIGRSLYGVDVMDWAVHAARLRLWLALIVDAQFTHEETRVRGEPLTTNIQQGDSLVQAIDGSQAGFDIVIGNPPYVRQEDIADPSIPRRQVTAEHKRAYKARLARTVYQTFPRHFGYQAATGAVSHTLDARSDLYIYFCFRSLSLLNPRGSFCFITSNAWLDVGYGAAVRQFLLKHCHVKLVLDNQATRSFAADVNTVIALVSAPHDGYAWGLEQTARFVRLKVPFAASLSPVIFAEIEAAHARTSTAAYRVYPISQEALLADGAAPPAAGDGGTEPERTPTTGPFIKKAYYKKAHYAGDTWGSTYLRAPDIYWTILEKGHGKLVRLGDIADVRRGCTTGANEFFYLDEARVRRWGIEEEFLRPAIKSPRACRSILVKPEGLPSKLLLCHADRRSLRGTRLLAYIQWGEAHGFHRRPTCAGRACWWDVGRRRRPHLTFSYLIDSTARTLYAPAGCYAGDNFQEIHTSSTLAPALCASLNSTLFQLMVNMAGRSNFGGGLLKIQTYELGNLLCLDPAVLPGYDEGLLASTAWDVLALSPERRCLDAIVFDALGLTQGERDAVYEAVIGLVEARLAKAVSLHRRGRQRREATVP